MKRGISVTRDYDYHNTPCVVITKKRGKLTIPEITDILHYEDHSDGVAVMPFSSTVQR